jgi:hypothetical protein
MSGLRGLIYTVFGALLLSALWVTSLTFLSARPAASVPPAGTVLGDPPQS